MKVRIIGVGVKFTISSLVYGLKPFAFRSKPCDKNVNFTPTPIIHSEEEVLLNLKHRSLLFD
jgi:hypothetical protein